MEFLARNLPFKKSHSANDAEEVTKVLALASCPAECSGEECSVRFPSNLSFDMKTPLWGSAKPFKLHILIATGQTDWPHSPTDDKDSLAYAINKWSSAAETKKIVGGPIKITTSSMMLPQDCYSKENLERNPIDRPGVIMILPAMVRLDNVTPRSVSNVLTYLMTIMNELTTDYVDKSVEIPPEKVPTKIGDVSIKKIKDKAIVLLCSHKTRDKRCGITAKYMKKEFDLQLREADIYRDADDERENGVKVYLISHVGGHKFAANVLIYLASGEVIWMARCTPKNVKPIIENTILQGKVWPEHVRTAFCTPQIDW